MYYIRFHYYYIQHFYLLRKMIGRSHSVSKDFKYFLFFYRNYFIKISKDFFESLKQLRICLDKIITIQEFI